ncbi:MAG: M17 family peptidase N-terminal domain-containing protein [Pseudomonadota bacterium]
MKIERYNRTLDELTVDLIVASLFDTDRPPRGVSGLADWRLNGFISRQILNGSVKGTKDEWVLLPLHRRLPARRLLLVGLGRRQDFSIMQARHVAYKLAKLLKGLDTVDVALSFPSAIDENEPGDTERAVADVLKQAQLREDLLVRWVAAPAEEPFPLTAPADTGSPHAMPK